MRNIQMKISINRYIRMIFFSFGMVSVSSAQAGNYTVAEGTLLTRWAKDVTPENVHQEYPRPQMVRKEWKNLNGLWNYSIEALESDQPTEWQGEILVPFPVESALSGVSRPVNETQNLWYQRDFTLPDKWQGKRWLLHFGAIDFEATVWVNDVKVGSHRGGYDPFSIDISDALKAGGSQSIMIKVWDPTSSGTQPRGKQVNNPGGIWYNAVTGIWQTVWLEPVPETYIRNIKITPDLDNSSVEISADVISEHADYSLEVKVAISE